MNWETIFGFAALSAGMGVVLVGLPAQIMKIQRSRSVSEISLSFILISLVNNMLWVCYAFTKNPVDLFLAGPNAMCVICFAVMLVQFMRFR